MSMRMCAALLILLVSAAGSALGQYSNSGPRNSNAEYQRRQNELQQQETAANPQNGDIQYYPNVFVQYWSMRAMAYFAGIANTMMDTPVAAICPTTS